MSQDTRSDPVVEPPYELAVIGLLTTRGPRTGWIATDGARTSDWLNHSEEVPIHGLMEVSGAGEPADLPTGIIERLPREDIIWAVPPPLPPNRHLRLHRRRVRVTLELEAYELAGQVHVRPGADATDALVRGARVMVPLTEVEVVSRSDPAERAFLPILIVNTSHVRRVVTAPVQSVAAVTADRDASTTVPSRPPRPRIPARRATATAGRATLALRVLLDEGIVDLNEFQAMLTRIPASAR